jgi:hypothetical protein
MFECNAVYLSPSGPITRRPQKNRNAANALRPASHSIDLRINGKIFPLHADKLAIVM